MARLLANLENENHLFNSVSNNGWEGHSIIKEDPNFEHNDHANGNCKMSGKGKVAKMRTKFQVLMEETNNNSKKYSINKSIASVIQANDTLSNGILKTVHGAEIKKITNSSNLLQECPNSLSNSTIFPKNLNSLPPLLNKSSPTGNTPNHSINLKCLNSVDLGRTGKAFIPYKNQTFLTKDNVPLKPFSINRIDEEITSKDTKNSEGNSETMTNSDSKLEFNLFNLKSQKNFIHQTNSNKDLENNHINAKFNPTPVYSSSDTLKYLKPNYNELKSSDLNVGRESNFDQPFPISPNAISSSSSNNGFILDSKNYKPVPDMDAANKLVSYKNRPIDSDEKKLPGFSLILSQKTIGPFNYAKNKANLQEFQVNGTTTIIMSEPSKSVVSLASYSLTSTSPIHHKRPYFIPIPPPSSPTTIDSGELRALNDYCTLPQAMAPLPSYYDDELTHKTANLSDIFKSRLDKANKKQPGARTRPIESRYFTDNEFLAQRGFLEHKNYSEQKDQESPKNLSTKRQRKVDGLAMPNASISEKTVIKGADPFLISSILKKPASEDSKTILNADKLKSCTKEVDSSSFTSETSCCDDSTESYASCGYNNSLGQIIHEDAKDAPIKLDVKQNGSKLRKSNHEAGCDIDYNKGVGIKVKFSSQPIKIFNTYSITEYNRKNEDINPVLASAEYELEKRMERMDIFEVELFKGNDGLGISIIGLGVGSEEGVQKLGIFVKGITKYGSAYKDGRLEVYDQIIEIDNKGLVGVSQEYATQILMGTRGLVKFIIGREKKDRLAQENFPNQLEKLVSIADIIAEEERSRIVHNLNFTAEVPKEVSHVSNNAILDCELLDNQRNQNTKLNNSQIRNVNDEINQLELKVDRFKIPMEDIACKRKSRPIVPNGNSCNNSRFIQDEHVIQGHDNNELVKHQQDQVIVIEKSDKPTLAKEMNLNYEEKLNWLKDKARMTLPPLRAFGSLGRRNGSKFGTRFKFDPAKRNHELDKTMSVVNTNETKKTLDLIKAKTLSANKTIAESRALYQRNGNLKENLSEQNKQYQDMIRSLECRVKDLEKFIKEYHNKLEKDGGEAENKSACYNYKIAKDSKNIQRSSESIYSDNSSTIELFDHDNSFMAHSKRLKDKMNDKINKLWFKKNNLMRKFLASGKPNLLRRSYEQMNMLDAMGQEYEGLNFRTSLNRKYDRLLNGERVSCKDKLDDIIENENSGINRVKFKPDISINKLDEMSEKNVRRLKSEQYAGTNGSVHKSRNDNQVSKKSDVICQPIKCDAFPIMNYQLEKTLNKADPSKSLLESHPPEVDFKNEEMYSNLSINQSIISDFDQKINEIEDFSGQKALSITSEKADYAVSNVHCVQKGVITPEDTDSNECFEDNFYETSINFDDENKLTSVEVKESVNTLRNANPKTITKSESGSANESNDFKSDDDETYQNKNDSILTVKQPLTKIASIDSVETEELHAILRNTDVSFSDELIGYLDKHLRSDHDGYTFDLRQENPEINCPGIPPPTVYSSESSNISELSKIIEPQYDGKEDVNSNIQMNTKAEIAHINSTDAVISNIQGNSPIPQQCYYNNVSSLNNDAWDSQQPQWRTLPLIKWGKDQVSQWMLDIHLEQYIPEFLAYNVNGRKLLMLEDNEFKILGMHGRDKKIFKIQLELFLMKMENKLQMPNGQCTDGPKYDELSAETKINNHISNTCNGLLPHKDLNGHDNKEYLASFWNAEKVFRKSQKKY